MANDVYPNGHRTQDLWHAVALQETLFQCVRVGASERMFRRTCARGLNMSRSATEGPTIENSLGAEISSS